MDGGPLLQPLMRRISFVCPIIGGLWEIMPIPAMQGGSPAIRIVGIGMPLALSILKGQGGDIDVDFGSRGEGTTFILKFFK